MFTALVTPFTDQEEVDWEAFSALVEWQIQQGVSGLVLAGSTGEGTSLSWEEKEKLFSLAVEKAAGKIKIIASTGTNLTKSALWQTNRAKELGVDACLLIVPYCNRPNFEGCRQHFEALNQCEIPFIIYHHPGRTGTTLSPEQLASFCELPYVLGVKDSYGNLAHATALRALTSKQLFCGDDQLALAHLSIGFDGFISVSSNVLPKEWTMFIREISDGNLLKARKLFYTLYPLCEAMLMEVNPQGVKYAVHLLEKCQLTYRLPLIAPSSTTQKEISKRLASLLAPLQA